jgi:hypothetical protein
MNFPQQLYAINFNFKRLVLKYIKFPWKYAILMIVTIKIILKHYLIK